MTTLRPRFKEINPTDDQEQIILGSNLGDGTLTSPYRTGSYINSALKILHSSKQEEYLRWKHSMLKPFVHPVHHMSVSDGVRVYFSTGSHEYFTKLRSLWYPDGKKVFTLPNVEHMNWLGLAVWFMDDGTRGFSHGSEYGFLSTEGFGMEVQPMIRDFLQSHFDLLTTVVATGHGLTKIRLSASAMRILKIKLRPHVIPSMLYKLGF